MPDLQQLADAATRIGATPSSFAASIVLLLFAAAFAWFGQADTRVKLAVFAALMFGSSLIFWRTYIPPKAPSSIDAVERANYTVDLQYTGAMTREAAESARRALQDKGWIIYGTERVEGFNPSIVKYGAASNKLAAQRLKDDVDALNPKVASTRFVVDPAIKVTHLEIWIGPR